MELITSYFFHNSSVRQAEYDRSLEFNLSQTYIDEIHLFITDDCLQRFKASHFIDNANYKKINFIPLNYQPTYKDLFDYAIKIKSKICCISNSDIEIHIDQKDYNLLDLLQESDLAFILTRHEHDWSTPVIDRYRGSHDSIVFYSDRVKNAISVNQASLLDVDYVQNTRGIEAILIIWLIESVGLKLRNPCRKIRLRHNHESKIRKLYEKIGYSYPTAIEREDNEGRIRNPYMIQPEST